MTAAGATAADTIVRPMQEQDLDAADRVMRLAFGTFLGLSDPTSFKGDADFVRTRWRAEPEVAFIAEASGTVVGSNFAANWGSLGVPGPFSVHPAFWLNGLGKRLMEPMFECFRRRQIAEMIFFTYAHSPRHVGWYRTIGAWPQLLTAIMAKPLPPSTVSGEMSTYSQVAEGDRPSVLAACRELTDTIYSGLDVTREIRSVAEQGLGDTMLLWDNSRLAAFAVCHCGAGTEAGSETAYVKFAAARPGGSAERNLGALLVACEAMAAERGLTRLVAGVNTSRLEAYRLLLARGYRIEMLGVAMRTGPGPGFDRPGAYVLNDYR